MVSSADVVLRHLETPMAVVDLSGTLMVVVWKTVGMGLVPGFDEIFGPAGTGAQYPLRELPSWTAMLYLALYGLFGTCVQAGSLSLAIAGEDLTDSTDTWVLVRAKALGLFHVVLGAHHVAWAISNKWGRFEISEYPLPLAKACIGVASIMLMVIGGQIMAAKQYDDATRSRKSALDTASFISMIPTFLFLPANWVGLKSRAFNMAAWTTTPYGLIAFLVWYWIATSLADSDEAKRK